MAIPTNFVRLASRAFHNSSRSVTTTNRYDVLSCGYNPVRSHRLIQTAAATCTSHLFQPQTMIERCINIRYFSGNGKGKKLKDASGNIDRSKFTHKVKIELPEVGEYAAGLGVIEKWYKKEGDLIKRDEVICDIRTPLFTFGMMTDDDYDSIMGEILVQEESEPIIPGTVICITLDEGRGEETNTKEDDGGTSVTFKSSE